MEEFSITVTIADRIYRLTIERKEEEVVRKAARLINERMSEYAKSYAFKDKQDLLAMVALQFTNSLMSQETSLITENDRMTQKLTAIEGFLDEQINKQNVL
jgi:cell division protein ZapA (FtsZ GTPase activity inhibitor)